MIIKGDVPCFKLWENANHLAFLSIAPIVQGHTLVIPKKHSEYIFDMEDEELGNLIKASKPIARKLSAALKPKTGKIGVMIAGLEVPHTHVHLIPMDSEKDLSFANAKQSSPEELKNTLEKISNF